MEARIASAGGPGATPKPACPGVLDRFFSVSVAWTGDLRLQSGHICGLYLLNLNLVSRVAPPGQGARRLRLGFDASGPHLVYEVDTCYSVGAVIGPALAGGFCGDGSDFAGGNRFGLEVSGHGPGSGDGLAGPVVRRQRVA